MGAGFKECPIPEAITPLDLLADPVHNPTVKRVGGNKPWAILLGDPDDSPRLLGLCETEEKANRRAEELEGEYPPIVDRNGNTLEIGFGDVLKLACRRPWVGKDPIRATRAMEVWQAYQSALKEERPMRLGDEYFKETLEMLKSPADTRQGDLYLAGAYSPVVVSQIQKHLIEPFEENAKAEEEEQSKSKNDKGKSKKAANGGKKAEA